MTGCPLVFFCWRSLHRRFLLLASCFLLNSSSAGLAPLIVELSVWARKRSLGGANPKTIRAMALQAVGKEEEQEDDPVDTSAATGASPGYPLKNRSSSIPPVRNGTMVV
eukprot:scaffold2739_cov257-Pinguiococcus_pyrenoidosus.AAC.37